VTAQGLAALLTKRATYRLVRRRTIAPRVLRARMQLWEHVVVPEIPWRPRLDPFAAPSAPGEAGEHPRLKQGTELPVSAAVLLPGAAIGHHSAALRAIGQHRLPLPWIGGKHPEVWVVGRIACLRTVPRASVGT
jgi:hypothetical protein